MSHPYRPQTISATRGKLSDSITGQIKSAKSISATDKFGHIQYRSYFYTSKNFKFGHRSDHISQINISHRQIRPHPYRPHIFYLENTKFGHGSYQIGQIFKGHTQKSIIFICNRPGNLYVKSSIVEFIVIQVYLYIYISCHMTYAINQQKAILQLISTSNILSFCILRNTNTLHCLI